MRRALPIVAVALFGLAILLLALASPERSGRRQTEVAPRPTKGIGLSPADASTTSDSASGSEPALVASAAAATTAAEDTSLLTLLVVRGRLVDPDKRPVAGAHVRLHAIASLTTASQKLEIEWPEPRQVDGAYRTIGVGVSRADGSFEIAPIVTRFRVGSLVLPSVVAWVGTTLHTEGADTYRDFNLMRKDPLRKRHLVARSSYGSTHEGEVDADGTLDIGDFTIRPRCLVTVRVRATGVPVSGVSLHAQTGVRGGGWFPSLPVPDRRTDVDGVARFEGPLRSGVFMTLELHVDGYATERRTVELSEAFRDVVVDLEPEALVEGRVLDGAGRPLARVEVSEGRNGTGVFADDEGRFVFHGLAPGPVRVAVYTQADSPWAREHVEVVAPSSRVEIRLQAAATLTAQVEARAGERVTVKLIGESGSEEWGNADESGRCEVEFGHRHSGTLRVLALAERMAPTLSPPITLAPGAAVTVPLRMPTGRRVSGQVLDARGKVAYPTVTLDQDGVAIELDLDYPVTISRVDKDGVHDEVNPEAGRFHLDLPLEDVTLTFAEKGYVTRRVTIPAGTTRLEEPIVLEDAR